MATIRKKGPDSWHVQIRRKGYPKQTNTLTTKAEAERWARDIESEMDRGVFVSRVESERTTIADLIDRYRREITPGKKNAKSEGEILDRLTDKFGAYFLAALSTKMVAEYRDALTAKGLAASTVGHYLNTLSAVIKVAMREWGYPLPSNPVANVKRPAQPKGRERRLLPGEEKRILRECGRYRNPILVPLVRLALETAMRQGELFGLKWEDIDLDRRTVILRDTKNGETRSVPLSPVAMMILKDLQRPADGIQRLPRGKVFKGNVSATRVAFSRAILRARVRYLTACERIGREQNPAYLVNLRFHDLRHEGCSRLFETGVLDMMEVASITGHKTVSQLRRYSHLKAELLAHKLAR